MFRNNPAHTGIYSGRPILSEPKLKWKFRTEGEIIASPTVDHGTVYVGSTDGLLYALDAKTGALRWKYKANARIASSAAIWNGTVYVGSYDRNFYAIDAVTGNLKWNVNSAGGGGPRVVARAGLGRLAALGSVRRLRAAPASPAPPEAAPTPSPGA